MTFCYFFTVPAGNLVLSQEDLNLIEVFNEVALPVPNETFGNEDIEANKKKILAKRQLPELEKPVGKGPFPCKECPAAFGSIFNTWGKYKKHMKTHEDDRRYREAAFSIWSSLLLNSYLYCEFEFINKHVHSLYFASNKVKRCYSFR